MTTLNKEFDLKHQKKILDRYDRYYNKSLNNWVMPSYIMNNIISETWDLSKVLNKHKKLNVDKVLHNVKFETLVDVKDKYNQLSQEDFYKYIVERLRALKD